MFPKQCATWEAEKEDIYEKFEQEFAETSKAKSQHLLSNKDALRCALRESVVGDVIGIYP